MALLRKQWKAYCASGAMLLLGASSAQAQLLAPHPPCANCPQHSFFWKAPQGTYGRNPTGGLPCGTACSVGPQGPNYGYFPTCWQRWPDTWHNCPVTQAMPSNVCIQESLPGPPQPLPAPPPRPPQAAEEAPRPPKKLIDPQGSIPGPAHGQLAQKQQPPSPAILNVQALSPLSQRSETPLAALEPVEQAEPSMKIILAEPGADQLSRDEKVRTNWRSTAQIAPLKSRPHSGYAATTPANKLADRLQTVHALAPSKTFDIAAEPPVAPQRSLVERPTPRITSPVAAKPTPAPAAPQEQAMPRPVAPIAKPVARLLPPAQEPAEVATVEPAQKPALARMKTPETPTPVSRGASIVAARKPVQLSPPVAQNSSALQIRVNRGAEQADAQASEVAAAPIARLIPKPAAETREAEPEIAAWKPRINPVRSAGGVSGADSPNLLVVNTTNPIRSAKDEAPEASEPGRDNHSSGFRAVDAEPAEAAQPAPIAAPVAVPSEAPRPAPAMSRPQFTSAPSVNPFRAQVEVRRNQDSEIEVSQNPLRSTRR